MGGIDSFPAWKPPFWHKDTARNAPALSCVFVAKESWRSNTMISANQSTVFGWIWTNESAHSSKNPRRCVSLSEIKVLKQPEAMPGTGGMGKLLQGLGLAPPPPSAAPKPKEQSAGASGCYPSPLEFARKAYSDDNSK